MKKIFKILGLAFLIIILCLVSYSLYLTDFGQKDLISSGILSNEPKKPKLEIPVTYNIGWWSKQKEIDIDSLKIDIVESKLSIFNSKSLIAYNVIGHLKLEKHWKPIIMQVHISERINTDSTINCDRIIEITPIVNDIENNKVKAISDRFEFRNEHIINSNHWGINRIRFVCGQKEHTIELHQLK